MKAARPDNQEQHGEPDRAAKPARRLYRRRVVLVFALIVAGCALAGSVASRQSARHARLEVLRRHAAVCLTANRATASPWHKLSLADQRAVCLALLAQPQLIWDGSLDDGWLVGLLVEVLRDDHEPRRRAAAAHALGDLATRTVRDLRAGAPTPAGLRPALAALQMAVERDPEAVVRTTSAAALVRFRPVARVYL